MRRIVLLSLVLLFTMATTSVAQTIDVYSTDDPYGLGQGVGAIEVAVNEAIANEEPNDIIRIHPGIYKGRRFGSIYRYALDPMGQTLTFRSLQPGDPAYDPNHDPNYYVENTIIHGLVRYYDSGLYCSDMVAGANFAHGEGPDCRVEGLTFVSGFMQSPANDRIDYGPAAIVCDGASPTITNCKFTGGTDPICYDTRAVYLYDSNTTIEDCTISIARLYHYSIPGDENPHRSAIRIEGSSNVTIKHSNISNNMTYDFSATVVVNTISFDMDEYSTGSLTIDDNCIISENLGVGLSGKGNCDVTITNSIFDENGQDGIDIYAGAIRLRNSGQIRITDCKIRGHNSLLHGAGIYIDSNTANLLIENCELTDNNCTSLGGAIYIQNCAAADINGCIISGNKARNTGAGIYLLAGTESVSIRNCEISNNITTRYGGGGIYNCVAGTTITNCTITENQALNPNSIAGHSCGGGILSANDINIINCRIMGNYAESSSGYGGGIYSIGDADIINCQITGNSTGGRGGGIFDAGPDRIINSTIANNYASLDGGGAYICDTTVVTNSIFWGNYAGQDGNQFGSFNNPSISYSDIQDGWSGTGNIDADPCFIDADTNDFHIGQNSPCIDAGDNNSVAIDYADLDGDNDINEPTPMDLDGFGRFIDDLCTTDTDSGIAPIVDMGAYEFLRSNINHDNAVNFTDYAELALQWLKTGCGQCNGADLTCDGQVDWADLQEFTENWLEGQLWP
ncbi:MAG: right-handed parallel beta-helix repeat-containing protein [Phycisphaerae bacterium]|nr:right-handed parallel beta-helix repeat-containing protein [Phycisphaerae bacterium]